MREHQLQRNPDPAFQLAGQYVRFLLSDQRNPGSMLNSLSFARENARTLRGTLPRASYEHINDAYLFAKDILQEPLSQTRRNNGLTHVLARLDQINGFLSSTMLHDAAWQFFRGAPQGGDTVSCGHKLYADSLTEITAADNEN